MMLFRNISLFVCLALAMAAPAPASRILSWTESPADLARGEADGIAISQKGTLFMAPRLTRLGAEKTPGHPQQVWAMASDAVGNLYIGTGPDGRIIKIGPTGSQSLFFTVDEPLVTALAMNSRGELLAATAPGGLIYKIGPGGDGAVWSETGERYVWSLAVGGEGQVYAGTGEKGALLVIDHSGDASLFFDSDEPHITSLLSLPDGRLLAGGAGRGLVYEIDGEGNAHVLYDGDLPEVVALASSSNGDLFAALVAPPARPVAQPSVRLRLPDGVEVASTDETIGALEEKKGPYLRGTIEGLTGEPPGAARQPRGSLVRILPDGEIEELWSATREAPFCLLAGDGGEALFGTGEPARLYHVDAGGDVALLSTLSEAQVTGLRRIGRAIFLSTSNPATSYRLEERQSDSGVYLSRPFDAGGPSRWGSVRWLVEGGGNRVELYTRSGNSRNPDGTWSGWSPALTNAEGSPIINPDGRFLQWRVRLVGSQSADLRLSSVAVSYEPYNRAPAIALFELEDNDGSVSTEALFLWNASDPDGEPVDIDLRYRPARSKAWLPADRTTILEPGPADSHKNRLRWDTSSLDEGPYEIQAVANDQAENVLGEGRRTESEPPLLLTIDRTPPRIEIRPTATGGIEIALTDQLSEIRRLELRREGRKIHTVRAADGMCDSRSELFRIEIPLEGDGWSVRGEDAAGNGVEQTLLQQGA